MLLLFVEVSEIQFVFSKKLSQKTKETAAATVIGFLPKRGLGHRADRPIYTRLILRMHCTALV